MDSQGRSRLLIGALTLAAVVLVIGLLLTQQRSQLPAAVESPLTINNGVAAQANITATGTELSDSSKGQEIAVAASSSISQAESPLAAPGPVSPLALPATHNISATTATAISEPVKATSAATNTAVITAPTSASITATEASAAGAASAPVSATTGSTLTLALVEKGPQDYGYKVLATFPHDPTAYTEGLQYIDGEMYESTGLYGQSTLRRVDLESGAIEQQTALEDQYFGEGIYVLDDHIYQLTWQSHVAFLNDRKSFAVLDQYSYPTEGWGLTYDGKDLLMSDGSATIFRRDPQSFEEVGRIEVHDGDDPVMLLNELEYIDGSIWANVWQTNEIVIIDPTNGLVTGRVDLTGLLPEDQAANAEVLNGIAYDEASDRIFVTGKFWPTLFQIELVPR